MAAGDGVLEIDRFGQPVWLKVVVLENGSIQVASSFTLTPQVVRFRASC
jgi:hypothetical protein